jgi:hypothetical protein
VPDLIIDSFFKKYHWEGSRMLSRMKQCNLGFTITWQ